jgi:chorismate mutase/prephenate dehydratase
MEVATHEGPVGYPGPDGSHSSAAAHLLFPQVERRPLDSFDDVVEAVAAREVAFGVLPIESSLIGPINETHDLIYESPLSIVQELVLPVNHCVLGLPGTRLESLRTLRSHPAAFAQCRRTLKQRPARQLPAVTTSDAAREVAESGDLSQGAIASEEAALVYGLEVLAADVGDRPTATRFVVLAPYTRLDGGPGWRTALAFATDHRPGALFHALAPFEHQGLNLVQLISRPLPRSPWRYRFDVVLDGWIGDEPVRQALAELHGLTRELRLLGSYAAVPGDDLALPKPMPTLL